MKVTSAAAKAAEKIQEKGSIGNQVEYAGKQYLNTRKNLWKAEADAFIGTAATVGATAAVAKSKTLQGTLVKGFNALKDSNFGKEVGTLVSAAKPYVKKGLKILKKLPGPAKAVLAAGTILTSIAFNIRKNKTIYEAGKIDQQYTDKAKLQKQLS